MLNSKKLLAMYLMALLQGNKVVIASVKQFCKENSVADSELFFMENVVNSIK